RRPQERCSMTQPVSDPARLRVLIVDDDHDMVDAWAMLLRAWNHEVRVAHNGPEALQIAAEWEPAVAMLDLAMPRMDGFRLGTLLLAQNSENAPVLIAITGVSGDTCRRKAQEAGFAHYLLKPADPEQLQFILQEVAARTSGHADRGTTPGAAGSHASPRNPRARHLPSPF